MVDWPVTLPQCPQRAVQQSPQGNLISFGTEVGPGKVRRRSTARTKAMSMVMWMTGAQFATFKTFFENDLSDGAVTFDWKDPTDQSDATFRFEPGQPYSATRISGDRFAVTLSLIKQP